jgi:hypothetical protein
MEGTTGDHTAVPSRSYLTTRLEEIRKRYNKLGFIEIVAKWERILQQQGSDWDNPDRCATCRPNTKDIQALVDAFGRANSGRPTKVTI